MRPPNFWRQRPPWQQQKQKELEMLARPQSAVKGIGKLPAVRIGKIQKRGQALTATNRGSLKKKKKNHYRLSTLDEALRPVAVRSEGSPLQQ